MKSKETQTEYNDMVDFSKRNFEKKVISVNGKKIPFAIGDKLVIGEQDIYIKTIVGVTIQEDNRIQYLLEWYNPHDGSFQTEVVTSIELKLLYEAQPKRKKVQIC